MIGRGKRAQTVPMPNHEESYVMYVKAHILRSVSSEQSLVRKGLESLERQKNAGSEHMTESCTSTRNR